MALQVGSSARGEGRIGIVVVQTVLLVCVLFYLLPDGFAARAHGQTKSARKPSDRFRFRVADSENDLPIQDASVALVYWSRKESAEEKKEIEVKTDKDGIAEFPRVVAEKFVVSVSVKGYRPRWRWIRAIGSEELIRMRLEKWASTPK
jgi:hypothetical protein